MGLTDKTSSRSTPNVLFAFLFFLLTLSVMLGVGKEQGKAMFVCERNDVVIVREGVDYHIT